MSVGGDIIDFIKGKIRSNTVKRDQFEIFFKDSLLYSAADTRRVMYCYYAACEVFGIQPGFGTPRADVNTQATPMELQAEFTKLGLGKFAKSGSRVTLDLRLADFFKGFDTAAAARKGLTPAKRDALKAEAEKLLKVPADAWRQYFTSRYTTFGVRG